MGVGRSAVCPGLRFRKREGDGDGQGCRQCQAGAGGGRLPRLSQRKAEASPVLLASEGEMVSAAQGDR